jgi:hypothetical protein
MGVVERFGAPWLAVATLSACTTTATISRSDGYEVEGWIRGGSPDAIVVDPRVGKRQIIPRSAVKEIDHPGNVHLLVGGLVLGYGAVVIANGAHDCANSNDGGATCFFMVTPALIGASIAVWGLATWLGSKDAAADTSKKLPSHEQPKACSRRRLASFRASRPPLCRRQRQHRVTHRHPPFRRRARPCPSRSRRPAPSTGDGADQVASA